MKQVKIRVKKDTILSKKLAKKIRATYEDKEYKKKKKKSNKEKFKKHDKKKDKKKKWKDFKKDKTPKKNHGGVLITKNSTPNTYNEIAGKITKLLKKNLENQIELTKLFSKLFK